MKLVIAFGSSVLEVGAAGRKFTGAVAQLLADGHRVTLAHGGLKATCSSASKLNYSSCNNGDQVFNETADYINLMKLSAINKKVVALLGAANIPALGICGADGNIFRIRKKRFNDKEPSSDAEVVAVDSYWLEVISKSGGVPVLAGVTLGHGMQCYSLDSDQMAAACAVGWDADALIFLTQQQGLQNPNGSAVRWIEAEQIDALVQNGVLSREMESKVTACFYALKQRVRRTRILPISEIDNIASFYFERIESGIEVILGVTAPQRLFSISQ